MSTGRKLKTCLSFRPVDVERPDLTDEVAVMLGAAGLSPSPAELARLVRTYEDLKPAIEALHGLAEARYEVPAVTFSPSPPGTWE